MKKNDKFEKLFLACPEHIKKLALTHSSYANAVSIQSNERLEFLGDSVLGLIVAENLYNYSKSSEGDLSKIKSSLVCTESLSKIAKEMDIQQKLIVGKSIDKISDSMLEDAMESMIGAIYLTHGLKSIKSAIVEMLEIKKILETGTVVKDYKTTLQEICQAKKISLEYKILENNKNFQCSCYVDGKFISDGVGTTKVRAEQESAKKAIEILNKL